MSYLALLPSGTADLEHVISRALAENPVLERRPGSPCRGCGQYCCAELCPVCRRPASTTDVAPRRDWRAELITDAGLELPTRLQPALVAVVASLDDHGLLPEPPDLASDDLASALTALRTVGPPGIAAADPVDCVRVQVAALCADGLAPSLLLEITEHWLAEIADHRHAEVAVALGVTEDAVAEAIAVLTRRVRPFVVLDSDEPTAAAVDVVFSTDDHQQLRSHVPDAQSLGLRLTGDLVGVDRESRAWLAPYHRSAGQLIAAVDARAGMLRRVADLLAEHQRAFILHSSGAHLPLLRSTVARALGVHPSTVGRAVAGKIARCPDGRRIPLPAFFGATISRQMIIAEALASHPGASDSAVAAYLTDQGMPLARRTVAKYRVMLAPASR